MRETVTTWGLVIAGLSNIIGVLVFSRGFTSDAMMQSDPTVMSAFGLVMIMVWGLAYISVAWGYRAVPWVFAVFAIEKLAYVVNWRLWLRDNADTLDALAQQDALAARFYSSYGASDAVFALFFAWAFLWTWRARAV